MKNLENALRVLKSKIHKIRTVQELSEEMGYKDAKYFTRLFRRNFGYTCKEAMIKVRVEKFIDCIQKNPNQKNYSCAKDMGLPDEIALNKYLRNHMGKNPTQFKAEIVNGTVTKRTIWKKGIIKKDSNSG
tara:strand:- start:23 stop:412 length:390 start_codon:yes stop_codon:yes gene_type:complete